MYLQPGRLPVVWAFAKGTAFTVVYQSPFPGMLHRERNYFSHSSPDPHLEYYLGGEGPYNDVIAGQSQLTCTAPGPVISITETPPCGEVKAAYPAQTLTVTNGTAPYKWSWKADTGSILDVRLVAQGQ